MFWVWSFEIQWTWQKRIVHSFRTCKWVVTSQGGKHLCSPLLPRAGLCSPTQSFLLESNSKSLSGRAMFSIFFSVSYNGFVLSSHVSPPVVRILLACCVYHSGVQEKFVDCFWKWLQLNSKPAELLRCRTKEWMNQKWWMPVKLPGSREV